MIEYDTIENSSDKSIVSDTSSDESIESDSSSEEDMNDLFEENLMDVTPLLYELTHEYVSDHILEMHSQLFHETMTHDIAILVFEEWIDIGMCDESHESVIEAHCQIICRDYFTLPVAHCAPRSYPATHVVNDIPLKRYEETLKELLSIVQPTQRTQEWFEFRHNLISASSLGKILGTEASRNRLIYEKCQTLDPNKGFGRTSVSSPMHWGQKYEPLSTALYEQLYQTQVSEFGCIQHKEYPFIGASPDGIVTKNGCPRFGRMLEIKNIFNREITGIPLKDYWIQMQVQMECCDLDQCDFLETRFKEYENEADLWADETRAHKGVMLYFVERISICMEDEIGERRPRSNTYPCRDNDDVTSPKSAGYPLAQEYSGIPRYEYMPLDIPLTEANVNEWIETTRHKLRRSWSLYTPIYWYLDQLSCVLVERNRLWFQEAFPLIENTWKTIEEERISGCEHRAPVKKAAKPIHLSLEVVSQEDDGKEIRNFPLQKGICLIKLDE